jgi:RNA polymerase sigma-70 factor, ECF subfamily
MEALMITTGWGYNSNQFSGVVASNSPGYLPNLDPAQRGARVAEIPQDRQLITRLLKEWGGGNKQALDELMPVVYQQLHKLAAISMRSERPDHTLRATALVHEAYLRLVEADIAFEDRVHFFAVAARLLRRILVDHAKANQRQKRGGGAEVIELDEAVLIGPQTRGGILELDLALQRLAALDQRKSEIIELLCFGGLTYDETAAALKISAATVHRELKLAKAWLHRELHQSQPSA